MTVGKIPGAYVESWDKPYLKFLICSLNLCLSHMFLLCIFLIVIKCLSVITFCWHVTVYRFDYYILSANYITVYVQQNNIKRTSETLGGHKTDRDMVRGCFKDSQGLYKQMPLLNMSRKDLHKVVGFITDTGSFMGTYIEWECTWKPSNVGCAECRGKGLGVL